MVFLLDLSQLKIRNSCYLMKKILQKQYRKFAKKKLDQRILKVIKQAKFTNLNSNNHILLTGSPRSGTTWLGQLLEQYTSQKMVFEPLSLTYCERFKNLGFSWRQHIPEDEKWDAAKVEFERLFLGEYLNPWMLSYTNPQNLDQSSFFIFKFVRANLVLPWLIKEFSFATKPIHLVRHPFAVSASQIHLAWDKKSKNEVVLNKFDQQYQEKFQHLLDKEMTPMQHHVLRWCLDNVYLLNHPDRNEKWVTVFYEELFLNPEQEFERMIKEMGLKMDEQRIATMNFEEVSTTSFKESPDLNQKKKQLSKWKTKLNATEIKEGLEVLNWFNIHVYTDEVMPQLLKQ